MYNCHILQGNRLHQPIIDVILALWSPTGEFLFNRLDLNIKNFIDYLILNFKHA